MTYTKTGLPFGCGSLQLRKGSLWAVYRDGAGKMVQRNLRTKDEELGLRLLAEASIPAAVARLRALEAVAYGETSARKLGNAIGAHADGRDPRRGPRAGSRPGGNRTGAVSHGIGAAKAEVGR